MRNYVNFDTGTSYPLELMPSGIVIPQATIYDLTGPLDQSTFEHISDIALMCNLVRNQSQKLTEKTTEDYIEAFIDGGTVAVGVARLCLKHRFGLEEEGFSDVEDHLRRRPIKSHDEAVSMPTLQQARADVIAETGRMFGFRALCIIGALRENYTGSQENTSTPIKERRIMAALGFAITAPEIEASIKDYYRRVDELRFFKEI